MKKKNEIDEFLDYIGEINEDAVYPTDLKDAIVGYVERIGFDPCILLDREKCLEIFVKRDKMTYDEAIEHFEFNVLGSYVGESTPMFATFIKSLTF